MILGIQCYDATLYQNHLGVNSVILALVNLIAGTLFVLEQLSLTHV